jgi:hypothetical protein
MGPPFGRQTCLQQTGSGIPDAATDYKRPAPANASKKREKAQKKAGFFCANP